MQLMGGHSIVLRNLKFILNCCVYIRWFTIQVLSLYLEIWSGYRVPGTPEVPERTRMCSRRELHKCGYRLVRRFSSYCLKYGSLCLCLHTTSGEQFQFDELAFLMNYILLKNT